MKMIQNILLTSALALATFTLTSVDTQACDPLAAASASEDLTGIPIEDIRTGIATARAAGQYINLVLGLKPNEDKAKYLRENSYSNGARREDGTLGLPTKFYIFWSSGHDSAAQKDKPLSTPEVPYISADFNDHLAWQQLLESARGKLQSIYFDWSSSIFVRWTEEIFGTILQTMTNGGNIYIPDAILHTSRDHVLGPITKFQFRHSFRADEPHPGDAAVWRRGYIKDSGHIKPTGNFCVLFEEDMARTAEASGITFSIKKSMESFYPTALTSAPNYYPKEGGSTFRLRSAEELSLLVISNIKRQGTETLTPNA
jgi:hypothetical protein